MNQQIIEIKSADILKQVSRFKREHARLVQILCTRVEEGYELTYTFDKDYFMYHLRCLVPVYRSVMSITGQYWYAFVWENEIHDLFGLKIDFIERDVDYGGHFYHLAEKTPWHDLPGEKHADQAIKVPVRSIPFFPNRSIWIWNCRMKRLSVRFLLSVMCTAGWKSLWNFVTSSSMSMWQNGSAGFVLSAMAGGTAAPWKK